MKKDIGYRIRKLRESRDYTQENMAAELGITAGAYAKIERGETDASITRLVNIAEILETDVINFLQDKNSFTLEEPRASFGNASKTDIDRLAHLISKINRELDKLKAEVASLSKKRK